MADTKRPADWNLIYREVLAGWHKDTLRPKMVFIQNDGTLVDGATSRKPERGNSPSHAAAAIFHLSHIRAFPIAQSDDAYDYCDRLADKHR